MKNDESCLCQSSRVLIFSCSGGSNVGQMANQAAVELTQADRGRLFCLAGIGAHLSTMIESARAGDLLVIIDGCPVKCAAKTLEHADLHPGVSLVITDMGIEKSHQLRFKEEDCRRVAEKAAEEISAFLSSRSDPGMDDIERAEDGIGA